MAYTSCITAIAANIAPNCSNPIVGGYTGRGILIPVDEDPVIVVDATNPRILTSITPSGANKFVAVDNIIATPFEGSNTASNADAGLIKFTKTISMRIPLRGAGTSKDIVEPLTQSALGFMLLAEKQDKVGDGSYEVIGYLKGLKVNADGISRDENANDGAISVTMSTTESWFEVVYFDTNYATTKAAFDTLLSTNTH